MFKFHIFLVKDWEERKLKTKTQWFSILDTDRKRIYEVMTPLKVRIANQTFYIVNQMKKIRWKKKATHIILKFYLLPYSVSRSLSDFLEVYTTVTISSISTHFFLFFQNWTRTLLFRRFNSKFILSFFTWF